MADMMTAVEHRRALLTLQRERATDSGKAALDALHKHDRAMRAEAVRLMTIISEIRAHAMRWSLTAPNPGDPALEILRLVNDGTTGPTIGEVKL